MNGEEPHSPPNRPSCIPDEIIVEILRRLPVKSLLKFRCVSKSWLSLISNPYFIKTHLSTSSNHKSYEHQWIIARDGSALKQCSLGSCIYEPITHAFEVHDSPTKNSSHPASTRIVGSCNGLVCVATNIKDVYLWNPSLRKSKKLPDSGFAKQLPTSYIIYGLAYNESNDDYIVMAVHCILRSLKTEVSIYSLKTDSWERLDEIPGGFPFYDSGKFARGKLHWVCFTGKSDRFVVSFDVQKREFQEIETPKCGDGGLPCPTLGILGGCLCVSFNNRDNCLELWMMKDYGVKESWSKIQMTPNPGNNPVLILTNEEILVTIDDGLAVYSPEGVMVKHSKITNMEGVSDAIIFFESLFSPNAIKR